VVRIYSVYSTPAHAAAIAFLGGSRLRWITGIYAVMKAFRLLPAARGYEFPHRHNIIDISNG
jgi:hypothetical protein